MGYVDKIRGTDGKEYTVSTTQKFDTWETAIFQGSALGSILGKRPLLVEVVLGDQPGEALLVHQRAVGLTAQLARGQWEMSKLAIKAQQEPAVQYVFAKGYDKQQVPPPWSPTLGAIKANSTYGPGTQLLLEWLERLAELDVEYEWSEVLRSAASDRSWSDSDVFAEAARIVEADAALRAGITYASSAIGVIAARTGAADQDAKAIMAVGRNAAVALLTRQTVSDNTFEALYAPFAEELPIDELDSLEASAPTTNPTATEVVASVENASPLPYTFEAYIEAAANVAVEFGEATVAKAGLDEDKKWLAERELALLYLGALDAWLRKLGPGETFDGVMSNGFAYLGAGAVAEDEHDEKGFSKAAAEMETVFRERMRDYGVLVLARPLSSSEALARAFALRLRAELGGAEAIEALAMEAFHDLPELNAYEVARQFLV